MPKSRSRRRTRRSRRKRRGGYGFKAGTVTNGKCAKHPCGIGSTPGCSKREAKRMELVASQVAAGILQDGSDCPKPGGAIASAGKALGNMKKGFVLPLVARYVRDLIKPNTMMPKTRQLLLDSFIYAQLVAHKYMKEKPAFADSPLKAPKYGVHTYLSGEPPITGGNDDAPVEDQPGSFKTATGGKRRRRSRRRRKSRKSRRKSKKSRKRKRSRRRRRR